MITVIGKHLNLFHERRPICDQDFFGAIHYIEQVRYKGNRFQSLCSKNVVAPIDFSPGIDVAGKELNHLYSSMIIWFELESYVKAVKSFLDHLWRLVAKNHVGLAGENDLDQKLRNEKYILQAFNKLKNERHTFISSKSYEVIENSLDLWRYWINFRNYIEYTEPLGGIQNSAAGKIKLKIGNSMTIINICLPDRFPGYQENIASYRFNFESGIMAKELVASTIENIDVAFPVVVRDIHSNSI